MPAYPVVELIAQAIKAALETISVAAGYEVDVAAVHRPTRVGLAVAPAHMEIVLASGARTEAEESECGTERWHQEFLLDLVVRPSDDDDTPFDTWASWLESDVRKALHADRTLGGKCIDLKAGPPAPLAAEDDTYEGWGLTVDVQYWTNEDDPYALAGA